MSWRYNNSLFHVAALVWSLALGGSLIWNLQHERERIMQRATAEARANYNKDIALRRWATSHGGIYVPITETQKSVPFLAHVPGRDVETTDGRRLTLLNPASVLRQTMDRYAEEYGIRGRITGLRWLNPANAPDAWEKTQLEAFTRGETDEVWAVADLDGRPHLRYLHAMYMEPGCEKCHAILGYKLGDMRGATGANLPLDGYLAEIGHSTVDLGLTHGGIWLLGLFGIAWSGRQLGRRFQESQNLHAQLFEEKERAEVTLASIGDAVITSDAQGRASFLNGVAEHLTGWSAPEARGRPVTEIFHIVSDGTRARVINPVDEVLATGKTVSLANHTVLIARDGREYHIEDSAAPIHAADGELIGCVLVFHDVTAKTQIQKQLQWQAMHDPLTGLPNRVLMADRFQRALANAKRQNQLLGVCMLDLDHFKPVNDHHGHEMGDQLLLQVAERLKQIVRAEDTAARLGGDEFGLLLGSLANRDELKHALERILEAIAAPYLIQGQTFVVTASIGVAIYPLDQADADTLLRHADQALYLAKQAGRNRFHWFDVAHDRAAQVSHQTLARVRAALDNRELVLHYQPKVNMRSGEVIGAEALLRWAHPEKGLVPPLEFLPLVEQSDLIVDIGDWVLEEALAQCARWIAAGSKLPVSVNIAARQFQQPNFVERLQAALERHPSVPPHYLDIEILESAALSDMNHVRQQMRDCQALGVTFSLDDFGTGYSSLSYLKRLPAETLKIDQSFVRDIIDDKEDLAVVEAVIGLAAAFSRKVVAEGVETAEHGVLLLRLGCDIAQGYGIARPMPAAQVEQWVAAFTPDALWRS